MRNQEYRQRVTEIEAKRAEEEALDQAKAELKRAKEAIRLSNEIFKKLGWK